MFPPVEPSITNKRDMYSRYLTGAFGNMVAAYQSVEAAKQGPEWQRGWLQGIRSVRVGGRCDYNVPPGEVEERLRTWPGEWVIQAMQPDAELLLQGEVTREPDLYLYGSTVKKPMRLALAEGGFSVYGLRAKSYLETYLDPPSYDNLMELLARWPDHIVEFSAYACPVGVLKQNTVIWEVRKY